MSHDAFSPSGIVTLLTDFGGRDGYAGSMKGVLLSRAANLCLVDISHAATPFSIGAAAFVLDTYCRDYPPGTVHLVVVDPGVGSNRRALAVLHQGLYYVAPDNGVLGMALSKGGAYTAWEITRAQPPRDTVSATFHGRDIFAPAAAHLASGGDPSDLGAPAGELTFLPSAQPHTAGRHISGEIIHVDSFGNLISNIRAEMLAARTPGTILVKVSNYTIVGMSRTYSDREPGELVAYVGSSGLLEIGIVQGSAAATVKTPLGRSVEIIFREKS